MGDDKQAVAVDILEDKTYTDEIIISDLIPVTSKNRAIQFTITQEGWTDQGMVNKIQFSPDAGKNWKDILIDDIPNWGKEPTLGCGIEFENGLPEGLMRLVCDVKGSIKFKVSVEVT